MASTSSFKIFYVLLYVVLFTLLGLALNAWHDHKTPMNAAVDGGILGLLISLGQLYIVKPIGDRVNKSR